MLYGRGSIIWRQIAADSLARMNPGAMQASAAMVPRMFFALVDDEMLARRIMTLMGIGLLALEVLERRFPVIP